MFQDIHFADYRGRRHGAAALGHVALHIAAANISEAHGAE